MPYLYGKSYGFIWQGQSRLSELIREAENGTDVIVARNGQPVAKIVPWRSERPKRVPGKWASHVALWWLEDNASLGPGARELIEQADEAYFSVVTPWELGIKRALGKLAMPDGLVDVLKSEGFLPLEIAPEHAELAPRLLSAGGCLKRVHRHHLRNRSDH